MKRTADRIDKMNKIRVSSRGFPEICTCQDGFALGFFDSLDDHFLPNSFILEAPCRRGPELVLSIL